MGATPSSVSYTLPSAAKATVPQGDEGKEVVVEGHYVATPVFLADNRGNSEKIQVDKKIVITSELEMKALIKDVAKTDFKHDVHINSKPSVTLELIKVEGETDYKFASTLYNEKIHETKRNGKWTSTLDWDISIPIGAFCKVNLYRVEFYGPGGHIGMPSFVMTSGDEKLPDLPPVKMHFRVRNGPIQENYMCGTFIQNNGTILVISETQVTYRGKKFQRYNISSRAFWTQEGAVYWYYIWKENHYFIFKYLPVANGIHEATPVAGSANKFRQGNGTEFTFSGKMISYKGYTLPLETVVEESPQVYYNNHGADRWYYISTGTNYHVVHYSGESYVANPDPNHPLNKK